MKEPEAFKKEEVSKVRVVILGCGAAQGVPAWGLPLGQGWGVCDPKNPKNRRTRASIFIKTQGVSLLVDTSPDLRQQGLENNIQDLDAVLYTHTHADHCHGINDLQFFSRVLGKQIPVYGSEKSLQDLRVRFEYAFTEFPNSLPHHSPFLIPHCIEDVFHVKGLKIRSFEQRHGMSTSLGFRIGDFAYSTDVDHLDDKAFQALEGVGTWVVDSLRERPSASHAHLALVLAWIEKVQPKRAVLTHLNFEADYEELRKKLPPSVEIAYDGMIIEF